MAVRVGEGGDLLTPIPDLDFGEGFDTRGVELGDDMRHIVAAETDSDFGDPFHVDRPESVSLLQPETLTRAEGHSPVRGGLTLFYQLFCRLFKI